MRGYVYVLSNPSMPGVLKIGRSIKGGAQRAKEINGTGVPTPFHLEFEVLCGDCVEVEACIHEDLSDHRVNQGREFFRCDLPLIVLKLSNIVLSDYDIGCDFIDGYVPRDCIDLYLYELSKQGHEHHPPELATALSHDLTNDELLTVLDRYKKRIQNLLEYKKQTKLKIA